MDSSGSISTKSPPAGDLPSLDPCLSPDSGLTNSSGVATMLQSDSPQQPLSCSTPNSVLLKAKMRLLDSSTPTSGGLLSEPAVPPGVQQNGTSPGAESGVSGLDGDASQESLSDDSGSDSVSWGSSLPMLTPPIASTFVAPVKNRASQLDSAKRDISADIVKCSEESQSGKDEQNQMKEVSECDNKQDVEDAHLAKNSLDYDHPEDNFVGEAEVHSDVESFDGKIVYNPDGSAYIIEGESDISDSESLLDVPQQEGSIVVQKGKVNNTTTSIPSFPQIASAFYIQRNAAALYNALYMYPQEKRKVGSDAPIMHSYRVYDLRSGKKPDDDSEDGVDHQSRDDSEVSVVPTKPILMCFVCNLSFGYAKSFMAHAIGEHNMDLSEEEKSIMNRKNSSAIIQGVGKDKDPLMSFLEPKKSPKTDNIKSTTSTGYTNKADGVDEEQYVSNHSSSPVSRDHVRSPYASTSPTAKCSTNSVSPSVEEGSSTSNTHINMKQSPVRNLSPRSQSPRRAGEANSGDASEDLMKHYRVKSPRHDYSPSVRPASPRSAATDRHSQLQSPVASQFTPSKSPASVPSFTMPPLSMATTSQSLSGMVLPVGCEDHPSGKQHGIECPKCDMVLGSSRSLGGHMTMMHSRNSCKTLKCPKCNWHYKYQETLEIHMKEKHPDNDTQCIYCITNQAHPRLARGEVYNCGYKPYRCEVCNYSTTTKGNLSIHMQSDKHINNIQELQNGGSMAEMKLAAANSPAINPVVSQSQAVAAAEAQAQAQAQSQQAQSQSQAAELAKKQQKPKPTWRCDVCNYETNVARNLRIHMTSEKHTHNMMVLQQNMKHMQRDMHFQLSQMAAMGDPTLLAMGVGLPNLPGGGVPPFPFDQSAAAAAMFFGAPPPHLPGMMTPDASPSPMDLSKEPPSSTPSPGSAGHHHHLLNSLSPHSTTPLPMDIKNNNSESMRLFQCCVCATFSTNSIESLHQHMQTDRTKHSDPDNVTVTNGTFLCNLCQYKTTLKANFQLHCKTDKHLQRLQLINHIREGGQNNEWRLKFVNLSQPIQVKCTCCEYFTNSIHKLQLHVTNVQHDLNAKLYRHLQTGEARLGGSGQSRDKNMRFYYYCALCDFSVRTKLSLIQHVRSLKHSQHETMYLMQLKEWGKTDAEVSIENFFSVKELKSGDNIKFSDEADKDLKSEMIADPKSESGAGKPGHDANKLSTGPTDDKLGPTSAVNNTSTGDHQHHLHDQQLRMCAYCTYSCMSDARLQAHVVTQHMANSSSATSTPVLISTPSAKSRPDNLATTSSTRARSAPSGAGGAKTSILEHLLCPLCQEKCNGRTELEQHLVVSHSVKKEGVDKLLMMVDPPAWTVDTTGGANGADKHADGAASGGSSSRDARTPQPAATSGANTPDLNKNGAAACDGAETDAIRIGDDGSIDAVAISDKGEPEDTYRCQTCPETFQNIDHLYQHQNELGHLEIKQTPRGPGYLCWKKGCNQYFSTSEALQVHFREIHVAQAKNVSVSDRHVYKYRCNQCSLAFKTMDKLNLHSKYHMIRAASNCNMCGRNFRSVSAMRKHVESTHMDTMTEGEKEKYRAQIAALPPMIVGDGALDEDSNEAPPRLMRPDGGTESGDDDADDDAMEIDESGGDKWEDENDAQLNTQAVAESSYNDASRKYKCHRCKVAFTRQNYLTAHNKTVMHRKGDKISFALEKYMDPSRPYKCDTCKESFTQRNILVVHFNSVSHLHKLKQLEGQEASATFNDNQSLPASESSSSSPASANNNNNEPDKKPFKCNICKVQYTSGSNLDTHIRSVFHVTRISKLQDLIMRGEVDLSQPFMEQPEPTPATTQHKKQLAEMLKQQTAPMLPMMPSLSLAQATGIKGLQLPLLPPSSSAAAITSSAVAKPAAVLAGTSTAEIKKEEPESPQKKNDDDDQADLTCHRCATVCSSPQDLVAHQQLQCLGAQPALAGALRGERLVAKYQPQLQHSLLQNFGFECAMQYNENRQRVKASEEKDGDGDDNSQKEEDVKPTVNGDVAKEDSSPEETEEPEAEAPPEMSKSKCPECLKDFSSIWVLKTHQEEVHGNVVPSKLIQEYSEKFKDDYEKTHPIESERAPSRSTPAPTPGPSSVKPEPVKEAAPVKPPPPTPSINEDSNPPTTPSTPMDLMAAQMMQQMPMFGMMPMHLAMNMAPPLMPMMLPMGGAEFPFPLMPGLPMMDPSVLAAQQQQQQQAAAAACAAVQAQQKRARTRISDDQLKILRTYFDINNSPSESQINEMAEKSGLPAKVIKHWFRNTLFKERQRNKDSPYNFSIPPSTQLNLEEYEKTGKVSVPDGPENESKAPPSEKSKDMTNQSVKPAEVKREPRESTRTPESVASQDSSVVSSTPSTSASSTPAPIPGANSFMLNPIPGVSAVPPPFNATANPEILSALKSGPFHPPPVLSHPERNVPTSMSDSLMAQMHQSQHHSASSGPKRANRTRFSDYQIQVLQEFFDQNAYPKDDDLDHMSKMLNLNPRVIVVWFQNARQKARKNYENQPPVEVSNEDATSPYQRTPGLNYQCKKCLTVFQRYYELIKHQKNHCFKDGNPPTSTSPVNANNSNSSGSNNSFLNTTPTTPSSTQVSSAPLTPHSNNSPNSSSKVIDIRPITPKSEEPPKMKVERTDDFKCDKCPLKFHRYDLWQEHQQVHTMNPALFSNFAPESAFAMLQSAGQQQQQQQQHNSPSIKEENGLSAGQKRKLEEQLEEEDSNSSCEQQRDKRLRTTILPEQLDYLYTKYAQECNPSRKQLDNISEEVGLKKRVVQVWFQNTRARERKGQYRAHQQLIHKRCPICRALFRAKSALESHLATKHPQEMAKGNINVDNIPDATDAPGPLIHTGFPPTSTSPGAGGGLDISNLMSNPYNLPNPFMPMNLGAADAAAKKFYEDSIKKYMDAASYENAPAEQKRSAREPSQGANGDETPLDLSKPLPSSRLQVHSGNSNDGMDISQRDETQSESMSENQDDSYMSSTPPSPVGSSASSTTPAASVAAKSTTAGNTKTNSIPISPSKRFRTQMTSQQIKIMKNIFVDYKTPTMAECEMLGREIGLQKRVVQVWFQNARAKEKKAKLTYAKTFGTEIDFQRPPDECKLCSFKYTHKYTIQDHIFTRRHIENVSKLIVMQNESPKEYIDQETMSNLLRQREQNSGSGDQNTSGGSGSGSSSSTGAAGSWPSPAGGMKTPDASVSSHPHLAQMQAMGLQHLGVPSAGSDKNKTEGDSKSMNDKHKADMPALSVSEAMAQQLIAANALSALGLPGGALPGGALPGGPLPGMNGTPPISGAPPSSDGGVAGGMFPYLPPGINPASLYSGMGVASMLQSSVPPPPPPTLTPSSGGGPPGGPTVPGADGMVMYDPATFGTPLKLLQMPPEAIADVSKKLERSASNNATLIQYTEDCKTLVDIKPDVSTQDFGYARESTVDVGYICRKCQMVYPTRKACVAHQLNLCYAPKAPGADQSNSPPASAIVKLEQIQYECSLCEQNMSLAQEFKEHCRTPLHNAALAKRSMGGFIAASHEDVDPPSPDGRESPSSS